MMRALSFVFLASILLIAAPIVSASPGYLKILNPVDGSEVPAGKLTIKWYYEGERPAFFGVFVDDKAYVAGPGARSYAVYLDPGKHVIRVIAYGPLVGSVGHPIIAYASVTVQAVGQGAEAHRPPIWPGVKLIGL